MPSRSYLCYDAYQSIQCFNSARSCTKIPTQSSSEHSSARKASRSEESEILDNRRCISCEWQGCSHVLLSSEDQAAHETLHWNDRSSSDSALLASKNNKRPRLTGAPEDTFPHGKKRQRVSRYEVHSTRGSSLTKARSSASSKTFKAKPFVRYTSKTDNSDMDQMVQHMVRRVRSPIRELNRRAGMSFPLW